MKFIIASSLLLFIVSFTACSSLSTEEQALDYKKLEQEVRDLFTLSVELFESRDLEGLVSRFTEDGILKLPGGPLLEGKEALFANYQGNLALEDFKIDLSVIKVDIAKKGDMASALAEFSVSFMTPAGPFKDSGISLMVLKREKETWKIASEILSSAQEASIQTE